MMFTCLKRPNKKIQIHKYANTPIQQMTKCHKDPTSGIFLKRGLIRDTNYDVHMSQTHKYKIQIQNTNTQIQKWWILIFHAEQELFCAGIAAGSVLLSLWKCGFLSRFPGERTAFVWGISGEGGG